MKMLDMDYKLVVFALIASVLAGLSFLPYHVTIAAWIWPAMMLYLVRGREVKSAVLVLLPCTLVASIVGFGATIWSATSMLDTPVQTVAVTIVMLILATLIIAVPFLIDSMLYTRCSRVLSLLTFPFIYAAWEISMTYLPLGSITSVAYSQIGFLPLLQGLSVFGQFGITFILGFFAAGVHYAVTECVPVKRIDWKPVVPVILVAIVILGGFVRMNGTEGGDSTTVMFAYAPDSFETDEVPDLQLQLDCVDDTVALASASGASALVFTEEAFCVRSADWNQLRDHAVAASKTSGVIVLLSVAVVVDSSGNLLNQTSLITPTDGLLWTYVKSHPVPLLESDVIAGDGGIQSSVTSLGKVSAVICYDMEFPFTMNTAPSDTDIMFAPSWDWKGLENCRTLSNSFRAIENGFNLVKCTCDGKSSTFDPYGREIESVISYTDNYNGPYTMSTHTHGVQTFYGQYGLAVDLFFVLGALVVIGYVVFRQVTGKKTEGGEQA